MTFLIWTSCKTKIYFCRNINFACTLNIQASLWAECEFNDQTRNSGRHQKSRGRSHCKVCFLSWSFWSILSLSGYYYLIYTLSSKNRCWSTQNTQFQAIACATHNRCEREGGQEQKWTKAIRIENGETSSCPVICLFCDLPINMFQMRKGWIIEYHNDELGMLFIPSTIFSHIHDEGSFRHFHRENNITWCSVHCLKNKDSICMFSNFWP